MLIVVSYARVVHMFLSCSLLIILGEFLFEAFKQLCCSCGPCLKGHADLFILYVKFYIG